MNEEIARSVPARIALTAQMRMNVVFDTGSYNYLKDIVRDIGRMKQPSQNGSRTLLRQNLFREEETMNECK